MRIEIEGEESSDQGDETYMYLSGSFGTIRVGNDDAASYSMGTAAPYATYFYGINTPYWVGSFSGAGNSNWHSTLAGAGAGGFRFCDVFLAGHQRIPVRFVLCP